MGNSHTIKLLHYYITNLDSIKIENDDPQVRNVGQIITAMDFDTLSLNGIQYDLRGVPNGGFNTTGLNLGKLIKRWGLELPNIFFTRSNLGLNARTKPDGSYFIDTSTPEALSHADELNFATLPGQLSTGCASKHKIVCQKTYSDLPWRKFNPRVDFSNFRTPNGSGIPQGMKLFDKSFSDLTLEVGDKYVHLILLHATPSHHFGNPKSINSYRNAEQLRFLEWYVSGETAHAVDIPGVTPLSPDDYYIIVGDLNVDINDSGAEGACVLKNIVRKSNSWISPSHMTFTNEAPHFAPDPLRLILDYIIVSKNIKVIRGSVIYPDFIREELGAQAGVLQPPPNKYVMEYSLHETNLIGEERKDPAKNGGQRYRVMIGDEYHLFKQTSHHYPIYGELLLE